MSWSTVGVAVLQPAGRLSAWTITQLSACVRSDPLREVCGGDGSKTV